MNTAEFITNWKGLQIEVHDTAKAKGWWADRNLIVAICAQHSPELGKAAEAQVKLAGHGLMHSELSESLESVRHGEPADDKIPEFTGVAAEMADTVIRIMDYAEKYNVPVAEAIVAKIAMNKGRAYRHGGKLA